MSLFKFHFVPLVVYLSFPFLISCLEVKDQNVQMEGTYNPRPIIGIIAQEIDDYDFDKDQDWLNHSYISAAHVKFLEGAGAQVVPIMINQDESYLRNIFSQINSLYLPGGTLNFPASVGISGFTDAARMLLNLAKLANDQGDYFPVWGTCQGLQFLVFSEAGNRDILSRCGTWNVRNNIKLTKASLSSKLYGKTPKSILNLFSKEKLAYHLHQYCLTPENFTKYGLDHNYSYLSVDYDPVYNLTYISSLEHKKYPFYGIQFHPERLLYSWSTMTNEKLDIPHSPQATWMGQYFANFIVDEARRSRHRFNSVEEENKHLIYNYKPEFSGPKGSYCDQKYYFPL